MPQIEQLVDGLIQRGRIQPAMREQYMAMLAGSPDLRSEFEGMLLRAGDYTNKTKELAEQRRQLEAQRSQEWEKIQGERRRLEDWERQARTELEKANKLQQDLPALAARAAAYEQTLRDYNMLSYVNVPETSPQVPSPYQPTTPQYQQQPAQAAPTNPDILTKQDAAKALQELMSMQGKVNRISAKHQNLFGQPLDDDLLEHYLTTGEDPEAHWRVKYAVATKEAEVTQRNRDAEIARIREEERAKLMSEYAGDPSRLMGIQPGQNQGVSPVLARYAQSRALAHAENHANDTAAKGPGDGMVPPEMKPELAAARERVDAATTFYAKYFDAAGNPINEEGRRFQQKYYNPEG